jgi:RimJ/RimL family protein N-acetyltransferase
MKVRLAKQSDKKDVLSFCTSTFHWGDYIDDVWDIWYSDPNGKLMVVEEDNDDEYNKQPNKSSSSIIAAVSHVYLCPNRNSVWLEGIRVRPGYRHRSIATELIKKMLEYGKEQEAKEAAAIVSVNNIASRLMMEKNGFLISSKWDYYSVDKIQQEFDSNKVKVATLKDSERICSYLNQSHIFKTASAKSYADSWRWYTLNIGSNILQNLIKNDRVLVTGNGDANIEGVAIIKKDNNVLQIGYIDASNESTIKQLVRFASDLTQTEGIKRYERLEIFTPQIPGLQSLMKNLGVGDSRQFLLYKRKIMNR